MEYIKLMRVKHWIKNLLIFFPIIFSGKFEWEVKNIINYILGFLAFSIVCSIVYVINDIVDAPKDRLHEQKKNRPIASGKIKARSALILLVILSILVIGILFFLLRNSSYLIGLCLILYLVMNLAYSFWLKNYPIIDVTIIALGFLIRTIYGGFLANIEISNWLYLTVLSMAFYLALGKRRNEIIKSTETRNVLSLYTKDFLDKNMYVCLALTIAFYALWATDITTITNLGNNLLVWTVPLVIIICMKYSLNIEQGKSGDPVEVLLKDKLLMCLVFIYMIFILCLYL